MPLKKKRALLFYAILVCEYPYSNHLLFQVFYAASASLNSRETNLYKMFSMESRMSVVELGRKNLDYDVFSQQVQNDINFLRSRLNMMRAQYNPNEQVIRTYENMLQSRLEVLTRLQDESHAKVQVG